MELRARNRVHLMRSALTRMRVKHHLATICSRPLQCDLTPAISLHHYRRCKDTFASATRSYTVPICSAAPIEHFFLFLALKCEVERIGAFDCLLKVQLSIMHGLAWPRTANCQSKNRGFSSKRRVGAHELVRALLLRPSCMTHTQ